MTGGTAAPPALAGGPGGTGATGTVAGSALDRVPAPLVLTFSALSVQTGSAVATLLFAPLGALGVLSLRLLVGAAVTLLVARAWRHVPRGRAIGVVVVFAAALVTMNALFYASLERIPLGVTVACELVGPLAVAVVGSRRRADLAWAALAVAGVAVLVVPGAVDAVRDGGGSSSLDPAGVALAVAAGACWAAYILLGARLSRALPPAAGLGWAMALGAVVLVPLGAATAGAQLWTPRHLLLGAAVGVLSAALPYALELVTLRRTGPRAFGVMMSLEPAAALLTGLVIAGQRPAALALVGIAGVVAASLGSGWRGSGPSPTEAAAHPGTGSEVVVP